MSFSVREKLRATTATWSPYLIVLAVTVFLSRLGQGLLGGASTNFLVDVLGLSGKQVLWLAGIREIPGLTLMGIAALIMHLPLSRRAAFALLLMGVGYSVYAAVQSYTALIAVALLASLGFHNWMPLQSSLALGLTEKENSGRILGFLSSMGSLASIFGMGMTALLATTLPLRAFYILGGLVIAIGGVLVLRIPPDVGVQRTAQPRLILKKRYWLYYVLIFFEGSRMQVFGSFGTLILVQDYGLNARQMSLLLVVSGIVSFLAAPRLGRLLDALGERITLSASYVLLAFCFVGYATVHNAWFLGAMLICINLLVTLRIGLSTYVNRIAPREELTPTLSAGVSINHVTSVSMSLVAGTLLSLVGYEWLCWGAAAVIMLSVPFALAIRVTPPPALETLPSGAE
jgi:predicted MFS family arabinose efflux permease